MNSGELKQKIEASGASFAEDRTCFRAAAPAGFCWEPGLHELVAPFGRRGMTKAEARDDLHRRVGLYGQPEKCDTVDCEWCDNV